jgi:malate/lactate dehydrogenase
MRSKVTCTATTRTGELAALLLAQLDLAEIMVVDGPEGLADDLRGAAAAQGYEPRISDGGWPEAAGAELVVIDAVRSGTARELAVRCPGAVIVVASDAPARDVERLLEDSSLPRARILGTGVDDAGPATAAAHAVQAADAVLRDRRAMLRCAVLCRGEGGEDGVRRRDVRVGAGGVQEIL